MRSGILFERAISVRRTGANGSSSWPAVRGGVHGEPGAGARHPTILSTWPTAKTGSGDYQYDHGNPEKPILNLQGVARQWPTPRAESDGGADTTPQGQNLQSATKEWATPTSHERTQTPRDVDHGAQLANQVDNWSTPSSRDWKDTAGMAQDAFDKSGKFRNRIDQLPRQVFQCGLPVPETERPGPESSPSIPTSLPPSPSIGAWEKNLYPTPAAHERETSQNEGTVPHQRPSAGTPSLTGWTSRRLNPLFVEWLMGLPP